MSLIKETAYTPKSIGDINFRIPLYQRPYAWGTSQVSQLLKDLLLQYEKDKKGKYYIGILSVGKIDTDDNLFDLIDGQQRITTLMLIGSTLLSKGNYEWKLFIDSRLDLYGREEDKKYLETLDKSSNPNPKMVEAINTISVFLENRGADFSKFIYENAAFFITEVPDDYTITEKNLQFVRMNNRGKQLEAHDILKIKLSDKLAVEKRADFVNTWNRFSQLGCVDMKDESQQAKSLKHILEDGTKEEQPKESEIFYQAIVSFPEFLLIALARFNYSTVQEPEYINVSHDKDKLLNEFGFGDKKLDFEWDNDLVINFHNLLKFQFDAFDNYFIKRDRNEAYKFKRKDNNTEAFALSGNELYEIEKLKVFQSYLYVSRAAHLWMNTAFDFIQEKKGESNSIKASEFLKNLKKIDNESRKVIENALLTYPSINRYWFWSLDYYLWEKELGKTKDQENAILEYTFRTNRSIEHLHAQAAENKWEEENEKKLLHSFGNLAMISSSFNSTQYKDPERIKFVRIDEQKEKSHMLESIKMLRMYQKAKEKNSSWTPDLAKEHGNEMIDILIDSFEDKEEYKNIRERLADQKYAK